MGLVRNNALRTFMGPLLSGRGEELDGLKSSGTEQIYTFRSLSL